MVAHQSALVSQCYKDRLQRNGQGPSLFCDADAARLTVYGQHVAQTMRRGIGVWLRPVRRPANAAVQTNRRLSVGQALGATQADTKDSHGHGATPCNTELWQSRQPSL